ncbi:MAG: lipocalin-like domain-containing protein [Opitutaceae bacterium]
MKRWTLNLPLMLMLVAGRASESVPRTTVDGFAVPQPDHVFSFPRDHGSHPEFKLEWWYVTGHLYTDQGRRFGFQETFFRQAGPDHVTQLHLMHVALVDLATGRFLYQERLDRAGWDAAAAVGTLDVRQGNAWLRLTDPTAAAGREQIVMHGSVRAEADLTLTLTPRTPLVIFGDRGVSRKGAAPTAASYYFTFPRLDATGVLQLGEERWPVHGEAWMDHEISSSQLDANQVGWDWAGIQLKDGREIMLYRLRTRDGDADPASALTWVGVDGDLQKQAFAWHVLETWKSPHTGAVYPSRVMVTTTDPATGRAVHLTIESLAANQEIAGRLGGIPYWEGACQVKDATGRVVGSAYLELTGYAAPLKL